MPAATPFATLRPARLVMTVSPKSVVAKISGEPNARTADPSGTRSSISTSTLMSPPMQPQMRETPSALAPCPWSVSA